MLHMRAVRVGRIIATVPKSWFVILSELIYSISSIQLRALYCVASLCSIDSRKEPVREIRQFPGQAKLNPNG